MFYQSVFFSKISFFVNWIPNFCHMFSDLWNWLTPTQVCCDYKHIPFSHIFYQKLCFSASFKKICLKRHACLIYYYGIILREKVCRPMFCKKSTQKSHFENYATFRSDNFYKILCPTIWTCIHKGNFATQYSSQYISP